MQATEITCTQELSAELTGARASSTDQKEALRLVDAANADRASEYQIHVKRQRSQIRDYEERIMALTQQLKVL